jgi:hypothetical protein
VLYDVVILAVFYAHLFDKVWERSGGSITAPSGRILR